MQIMQYNTHVVMYGIFTQNIQYTAQCTSCPFFMTTFETLTKAILILLPLLPHGEKKKQ